MQQGPLTGKASRIRELAGRTNITTSAELAERAGVSNPTALKLWEHGPDASTKLDTLSKIAGALGVDVRDLLEDPPRERPLELLSRQQASQMLSVSLVEIEVLIRRGELRTRDDQIIRNDVELLRHRLEAEKIGEESSMQRPPVVILRRDIEAYEDWRPVDSRLNRDTTIPRGSVEFVRSVRLAKHQLTERTADGGVISQYFSLAQWPGSWVYPRGVYFYYFRFHPGGSVLSLGHAGCERVLVLSGKLNFYVSPDLHQASPGKLAENVAVAIKQSITPHKLDVGDLIDFSGRTTHLVENPGEEMSYCLAIAYNTGRVERDFKEKKEL